jgi:hypothetical protein
MTRRAHLDPPSNRTGHRLGPPKRRRHEDLVPDGGRIGPDLTIDHPRPRSHRERLPAALGVTEDHQ